MDDDNQPPTEDSTTTVDTVLNTIDNMRRDIREMTNEVTDLQLKTVQAEIRLANMKKLLDKIEAGKRSLDKKRKK